MKKFNTGKDKPKIDPDKILPPPDPQPSWVKSKDQNGNTPLRNLAQNYVNQFHLTNAGMLLAVQFFEAGFEICNRINDESKLKP